METQDLKSQPDAAVQKVAASVTPGLDRFADKVSAWTAVYVLKDRPAAVAPQPQAMQQQVQVTVSWISRGTMPDGRPLPPRRVNETVCFACNTSPDDVAAGVIDALRQMGAQQG